jgi:GAF domain-containing protein
VLVEIVKYVGACCGAIFVTKDGLDSESVLAMSAGYAVNKKRKSEEVASGQGQVGQCFLKGEKIYITQVPNGYLSVASGLGEAAPRCVLLLPLQSSDKTVGVLELASFLPMTSAQLLFLEKISEGIAGAIQAVKEAEKQEKLLEQSKIMTLALTKREEELQHNIDQMNILQENQLRKQNELELAYEKIQEKNKEIEAIQRRETELIESKLQTNQQITDKVIAKLRSKIEELQNRIQMTDTLVTSSLSGQEN